ncbi:MAG: HAD-IIA family hydrolase [Ilumatobacteraceae bacterium]
MKSPVLCDLDGVVWLMHEPIAGSVEAIARLRQAGHRVLFVTNNSSATLATQEAALAKIGVPAVGDVCTSAQAAALLLRPGERVLVAGGPGIVEAIGAVGAVVVARTDDPMDDAEFARHAVEIDTVMVGYHSSFDYQGLTRAVTPILGGARLIGTNDDPTYPTPAGLIPGGGSLLAAIAKAGGVRPIIAGKPFAPMGQLVRQRLGINDLSVAWMAGDRDSTDGAFARLVSARFALMLSGVSESPDDRTVAPDAVFDNLAGLADHLLRA